MKRNLIKTSEEIETLKAGGRLLAQVLGEVKAAARPGVATKELDMLAERLIKECGGEPSFKGYKPPGARIPYPSSLCVSVNDEVVHAIPRHSRALKEGDIVGLDIGMWWPLRGTDGKRPMVTDMAVTVGVGEISEEAKILIRVTKEALFKGIEKVKPGASLGDVGAAIQAHIEKHGFGVVRDLAGHGVGYQLHEEPLVPNFGRPGGGPVIQAGMVLAIEPMATEGHFAVVLDKDEWTFRTADGRRAAHFEHTIVVTDNGGLIVTQS